MTSGIDGTYPAGLAVAQVTTVERDTGQMFARDHVQAAGGRGCSPHLLVLGRAAALAPRPEEPAEAGALERAAARAGRGG